MSMNLPRLLPLPLKNDFWIQFMEAVQELFEEFKVESITPKSDTFDLVALSSLGSDDQLIEVAKMLGYQIDRSLRPDDLEFLKKEVRSVPFRITRKTTPVSWDYIFNTIPIPGTISVLYWDGQHLIRPYEDFELESVYNTGVLLYPGKTNIDPELLFLTLDFDPVLYLDSVPIWTLDQEQSRISTSHMSIEMSPEGLIIQDSSDFTIVKSYADFLLNASQANRKVSDSPHVGIQLNFLMDSSGYFDSNNPGASYSSPVLKNRSSVTDLFSFVDSTYSTIKIGTGSNALPPSTDATPVYPTQLQNRIFTQDVYLNEFDVITDQGVDWLRVSVRIPANTVNAEVLGTGDDSTLIFSDNLAHPPIKKNSVSISFKYLGVTYAVTDDGDGELSGEIASGSINYITGAVILNTEVENNTTQTLHSGTDGAGNIVNGVSSIDTYLGFTPITPGSFRVTFRTGGGNNLFTVSDNGDGTVGAGDGSDGIAPSPDSTIDYTTGEIHIYFSQQTDEGFDILSDYLYTRTSPPTKDEDIVATYAIDDSEHYITEAGLFTPEDDLIAYATFPPVNLGDNKYDYFINFFMRNGNFT